MPYGSISKESIDSVFDFTRCRRPNGTFYGTHGKCKSGVEDESEEVDTRLLTDKDQLSDDDLDKMAEVYKIFQETGVVTFPFKIPKAYDDKSGTVEATLEITNLRDRLEQDKKTGIISVPPDVVVSKRAKELIDEWNALDRSIAYINSGQGTQLNVGGLGATGGPRNSVPKDAIRGLVQYVGLMRQDAKLIDTPDGKIIDTYRDPFTGKRRPFEVEIDGKRKIAASQDHWERPFGIYGINSENDPRNTVYMPVKMNVEKGESSPGRYLYRVLAENGRIEGSVSHSDKVMGGFKKRFDEDESKDFLPKGQTRAKEAREAYENSIRMINTANNDIKTKYIPKIEKALESESVSADSAAKLLYDIAKQESAINYYALNIRMGRGARIHTPYEQQILDGIKLNQQTGPLTQAIAQRIRDSGEDPKTILREVIKGRSLVSPLTPAP